MKLSDYIAENRRKMAFLIFCITIIFLSIIVTRGIHYEFEEENFLPENETVKANEEVLNEYTNEYMIPALVKSKDGNILNKTDLLEILHMEKRIYESTGAEPLSVADIIASVFLSSNISIDYEEKIKGIENISNEDIIKLFNFPFFPKGIVSILLSKDFDEKNITAEATVIKVSLNGSLYKDDERALEEERKVKEAAGGSYEFIEPYILGGKLIEEEILQISTESLSIILLLSILFVIIVLFLIYRSILDVVLSLLSLAIAIIWTYGFASALNYSLNPLTMAIPVLLTGLGIDYSIHLRMRIREDGSTKIALKTVGTALFLSALTSSIAFLSNISSFIPALRQFGILSAFGIFSCLAAAVTLAPFHGKRKGEQEYVAPVLANLTTSIQKRKKIILFFIFVITIFMGYSAWHINAEFDMMKFLPEKLETSQHITYLIQNFEGVQGEEVDILIKDNMTEPEKLEKIYHIIENAGNDPYVVKVRGKAQIVSIFSVMKDYANKSYGLHYNATFERMYNMVFYENGLPKENATYEDIAAAYALLYSIAPDDMKHVIHKGENYDGCVIRISTDTGKKEKNISILFGELKKDIGGEKAVITGSIISTFIILKEIRSSQIKSLFLTILFSFIVLETIFLKKKKSFALGFIITLPVIISSLWIIGTMSLFKIPLTITTVAVSSLTIGLGIDYSIHIAYKFLEGKDSISSISRTGSALFGAALTTIAAFGLLSFSPLPQIRLFGMAISVGIVYSFILCAFILPILLQYWKSLRHFS